jgi:hypothetical protein
MPSDPTADELRRRAAELRRYAAHLAATPLDEMVRWAGADTWSSPRAGELLDELRTDGGRLRAAGDDLLRWARSLDVRADGIDEQARLLTAQLGAVR